MATLFEYVRELDEIMLLATDEDGVISDDVIEKIDALELAKEEKVDNCISYIKSRKAMAEALKNEKQAIEKRQKTAEREAERVKDYLMFCLNGSKWESTAGKISYRKSESVEVGEGFKDERFLVPVEPKLDKVALKDALKKGEVIEGAQLVEKQNMQIK